MQVNRRESSLRLIMACLMLAGTVFLLAETGMWLTREAGRVAALWLANAAALAALLRSPRRHWPILLGAALVANIAANLGSGDPAMRALALSLANAVEVLVAAQIVVGRLDRRASFDDSQIILRFLGAAGLVAPFCSAVLASAYLSWAEGAALLPAFTNWMIADALGLLTLTPLLLSIELHDELAEQEAEDVAFGLMVRPLKLLQAILFAGAGAGLVALTFYQSAAPLLFLVAPILVFSALRQSLGASMLTLAASALVATAMTIAGYGPIQHMVADPIWRIYVLQSYIAVMIFLVLPVRAVVSERNRLGHAFEHSERKFAGIAEASPAGILHLDHQGLPTWANQKWQQLTGHDPALLEGDEWLQVAHPADIGRAQTLWTSVRARNRADSAHLRKAPQLGEGWFELALHPQLDGSQCVGFVARLSDISDRKKAEASLMESEELYRLVTENARDMIFRISLDGISLYVSSAAKRVLGHDPAELVGKPLRQIIHPDDWPMFAHIFSDLLVGSGAPDLRFRQRVKGGDYLWVEGSFQLILGERGEPLELIATVRDVQHRHETEVELVESAARLKESNRLLTLAEELAGVAHWRFDAESRGFAYGAPLHAMTGIGSNARLTPRTLMRLLDGDGRRVVLRTVARARSATRPCECSIDLNARDGQRRHMRLIVQAERDPLGHVSGLFGVARDVTLQVRANSELVRARDRAKQAAEAKSNFLATMSHEIRTPMTGVLGMIDLLRAGPTKDQRVRYLDTLKQSADLLMAVLDDILDFSKIESGRVTFEQRDFRFERLIGETLSLFDSAASAKGLTLAFSGPAEPPQPVRGDPVRLQQILSNLLSNAVKFTDSGSIRVSARVVRALERQLWRIEIADSGIGMDEEDRTKLFQPFVQANPGALRHKGGTGLGLAISRRLVEAMGGAIGVDSVKGRGSTFWFEVPLTDGDEARIALSPAAEPIQQQAVVGLRLLVAEDNPVNQMLLGAILRNLGHEALIVDNGARAVEAAAEPFDAIIMDMQMPEMDGLAATRQIRASGGPCAAIPIIALTADASPERRRFYDGAGLSAFLTKPIDQEALSDQLACIALVQHDGNEPAQPSEAENSGPLDPRRLAELDIALGADELAKLLGLLRDEVAEKPALIRAAVDAGDSQAAAGLSHNLKGAASNAGAMTLAATAAAIETRLEAGDVDPLLDRLGEQAAMLISAIDRRLDGKARSASA